MNLEILVFGLRQEQHNSRRKDQIIARILRVRFDRMGVKLVKDLIHYDSYGLASRFSTSDRGALSILSITGSRMTFGI